MRRWIWLLGLLVVGIAGTVWWSSRNAVRLEPLDAQRFAQMSEIEQVEWLIEQVLARSKRTDTITTLLEKLPFVRQSALRPLSYWEIEAIGIACVEYDLPHWLSRSHRYAETESYREHLRVYQAILQARKGDWQAAEQTVQQIRTDPIKAFARAHLGRLKAEAGQAEAARRDFERAYKLLSRPVELGGVIDAGIAFSLLVQHSHLGDNPEAVMRMVQFFPTDFQMILMQLPANVYRQRGDIKRLRQLAKACPTNLRSPVEQRLVQALIEQGRVDEGLQRLAQLGECDAKELVAIVRSVYQQGRKDDALRLANQMYAWLEYLFTRSSPQRQIFKGEYIQTPYGEIYTYIYRSRGDAVFITHEQLRVLGLLASLYIQWGQAARAEQLVNASPYVRMENYAPHVYANLARACHELGKHAQARRYLEQALKEAQKVARSSNDLSSENWLIRVACDYASLGDHTRALEIAQTMRPNSQLEVLSFILLEKVRTRNPFWRELVW
jgi:tetratricopeptide (TPR) repeat protein